MPVQVPRITIDTREQTPWHFGRECADVSRGTLPTGDYAVTGDLGYAVERKSLDDFLGTISTGWDRFRRELGRARRAGYTLPVIVEGSLTECFCTMSDEGGIIAPSTNHPALTSAFVLHRIGQIFMLGGAVVMAENPFVAAGLAYTILNQRNIKLKEGEDAYENHSDRKD